MNCRNIIVSAALISFFLYFTALLSAEGNTSDDIVIYNMSSEIMVSPGSIAAAVIAVEIPDGLYIYANPKGKGIGKATVVSVENNKFLKSWEARYPDGESYQAKGDTDSVNIYKKNVRLPVAFTIKSDAKSGDYSLKAKLSILMCSTDACIPVDRIVEIPVKIRTGISYSSPYLMDHVSEFLALGKNFNADMNKDIIIQTKVTSGYVTGISESIIFTPRYPEGKISGIFEAVIFGLIAGFILNFMPCVLPVVSLKIMSFVKNAGENKKVIITQGFLFSSGIIVSFLALATLAAFFGYKWGGLFQHRLFIIVMTTFVFVMALSLLGVFTFNTPSLAGRTVSKTHGIYIDAFIKGVMATLLATPCSGPFLGGTLAWTLTRPPEIIFVIFLSVGIGMAAPYMLLAFNPSLLRIIPKPGVWMNHFESVMGFLLMFTVVYLLGVLESSSRMGLVLFLLFLSVGLWQYGKFGSIDKNRSNRAVSLLVLAVFVGVGYGLSFKYFYNESTLSHEKIPFSEEQLLSNRDNGIITVVEFTAEWCPNCSLVEKLALEQDDVQKLFSRDDIEFMIADITQKDSPGESLMNRLNIKSIPVLAIMPPGDGFSSPLCLRDIYSAEDVIETLNEAEKFLKKK